MDEPDLKFTLRIPPKLHRLLRDRADREKRSLQGQIVFDLWKVVGEEPEAPQRRPGRPRRTD